MKRIKSALFASLATALVCAFPSFFICIFGLGAIDGTAYFASGMFRHPIPSEAGYIMIWVAVGLMVIPALLMGVVVFVSTFITGSAKKNDKNQIVSS